MKNRKIASLLILSALFATGCENNANVSSSNSNEPSSSQDVIDSENSSISSEETKTVSEETVKNVLGEMKKGNFTLGYNFSSAYLEDVITPSYYYTAYLNNGSLLLKTISETPIAYDYEIIDGKVELKGQTFDDEQKNQGLTSLAFANKLSSLNLNNIVFEKEGEKLVTYDENLISLLSSQLDFSKGISKISFFEENGFLTFSLHILNAITNKYEIPQGGTVNIKNVGTSKVNAAETFLSSWTKPSETLANKGDNIFGNVSFASSIYDYTIDYNRAILTGSINFDIYNQFLRITTLNADDVPYMTTYEHMGDNSLKIIGVDGHNNLVSKDTNKKYSDFALIGKSGFELDKFAKIEGEDNYYLYLGANAKQLAYSITQSSIFSRFNCLKIQVSVENDKITYMHFYTGIMQDPNTSEFYYYRIDTKVLDTPNVITKEDKKIPSKDDEAIKEYLSSINNLTFTAEMIDSGWDGNKKTYITKGNDFILKETYTIVNNEKGMLEIANGYYFKDGKTYSITYNTLDAVEVKASQSKTLNEVINFTISSEILSLEDDTLTTTGDIINIGESLGIVTYKDYIDPATLKITVGDNKISSIYYVYGGDGFTGNEIINFTYEDVSLSEQLRTNIENALPKDGENQTWESYTVNRSLYKDMVDAFGEETAKKVPYLADDIFVQNGFDGYYSDEDGCMSIGSSATDNGYIKRYKAYIKTLGYVSSDNETFINEADNLKLVIGDDLFSFLQIYLINA